MKKFKLFGISAIALLAVGSLVACNPNTEPTDLTKIKIGLHENLGAGAGYSAIQQGYFKEEGIDAEPVMGGGPALATALVSGEINISFMGGGVAWNYFTTNQEIKIVALDNLTDDDRLIATTTGKGKDLTINSTLVEIGNVLKGAKVALDFDATPKTFWNSLLNKINADFTTGSKLWYEDDKGDKFPTGLSDSDYVDSNKVLVYKLTNTNIPVAMQNKEYDFCVAFSPAATKLETDTSNFKVIAKTSTHLPDDYQPSTWGVNAKWLESNKETFQKVMNGLVKGMNYRHDNPEGTCKDIETLTAGKVLAKSMSTDIAVWLNAEQQLELDANGNMKKYSENIRQAKLEANPDKVDASITVEKATDFSYLLNACKSVK